MEKITTAEAARRLGLSRATVRRRCTSGELPAQREDRPGGVVWWVLWTDELAGALTERTHEPAHERTPERGSERDALAIALHTIGRLERELEVAHAEKAQLLHALNARALSEPARERTPERTPEPARRPWWRFWRKG